MPYWIGLAVWSILLGLAASSTAAEKEAKPTTISWVRVAQDNRSFVLNPSGQPFAPWGFNYDHDEQGRLLEDYWEKEWPKVEADFREMKQLGANVVRVHLQVGKFMTSPEKANEANLDRLGRLVALAEKIGLYLDITGLGCYRKKDVPPWYDRLGEQQRWDAQARFWEAVAQRCCQEPGDLLLRSDERAGAFQAAVGSRGIGWGRPSWAVTPVTSSSSSPWTRKIVPGPAIARQWCHKLVAAIRKHDQRHLVTVGLVPWSLDRPGLTSGFVPKEIAPELDFIAVHLYPENGQGRRGHRNTQRILGGQASRRRGDVPAEM